MLFVSGLPWGIDKKKLEEKFVEFEWYVKLANLAKTLVFTWFLLVFMMCAERRKFCQHTQIFLCKTPKNHSPKVQKSTKIAHGTLKINQKRIVLSKIGTRGGKLASRSSKMSSGGGRRLEGCLECA